MPPLPGASPQRQPVHSDADFSHPDHPFALVVNIPLVTMTPHNGTTELWLGTHRLLPGPAAQVGGARRGGGRASGCIRPALLAARQGGANGDGMEMEVRGPSRPVVRKGSVVVRDLRLWHAGMPNASGEVRVMLAMIHFAAWYRSRMKLALGEDVRSVLAGLEAEGRLGLDVGAVDWAPREAVLGAGGYLDRGFGNSYDFDQEP